MTLADRCDRVMALIDEVLDTGCGTTVDATSVNDALVDPTATLYPSQGR